MAYNPELRTPFGYGTGHVTLGELRDWLLVHHHPEYVRRLLAWLTHKGGFIGVGGGYREVQPTKDGFAPEGKSFHQNQTFADGFVGAAAVDLVVVNGSNAHRAPRWSDVPAQGSTEARTWGVHCNVPGEPWHMQPIEIDGWQSWKDAGSPAPVAGYPLPGESSQTSPPQPIVNPEEDDMTRWLVARTKEADAFLASPGIRGGAHHMPTTVPRRYPFLAMPDGRAYNIGTGKLVTDWGDVTKVPEAEALQYMGPKV